MDATYPLELLVRTLSAHAALSADDRKQLLALPFSLRTLHRNGYLVREGEPPAGCGIIVSGHAYRHKLTGDGNRQIVSFHIPGEPIDLQTLFLAYADHNVQALTEVQLAMVSRPAMEALVLRNAGVARAVLIFCLVEASISREWTLNVGRRNARARLAHLLCEFAVRMDHMGLAPPEGYALPMTQEHIGDALGLTAVHVNRTIKALEGEGLIARAGRTLSFPNIDALREIADFNPLYLHMQPRAAD